jgi:hypothetical protein
MSKLRELLYRTTYIGSSACKPLFNHDHSPIIYFFNSASSALHETMFNPYGIAYAQTVMNDHISPINVKELVE